MCHPLLVSPRSYKDYRNSEDYSLTHQFWLISAMRFAFVILFEVSSCIFHNNLLRHLKAPDTFAPGFYHGKANGIHFISCTNSPFVCLQHVVVICKFIAAWFVPSAPMQVKNDRLFDKLKRLKEELK